MFLLFLCFINCHHYIIGEGILKKNMFVCKTYDHVPVNMFIFQRTNSVFTNVRFCYACTCLVCKYHVLGAINSLSGARRGVCPH